ncbi:MAG: hypothetical protein IJT91_06240, partial [Clostridia bacterium]|nr:hypothetical protein [Clostridia bacterium]
FIFACPDIDVYSDESFSAAVHPAYVEGGDPKPSYLYGGDNVCFDAHLDFGDFRDGDFSEIEFEPATVYENRVWGDQILSPLPLLKIDEKPTELDFELTDTGAIADLPYAMTASFSFEAECDGSEIIDIRTDRYNVNGGPGDEFHNYNGHRIEYTSIEGKNSFESPMYLYGEKVIVTFPKTVKLKKLYYRESGYNSEMIGSFVTDNALFNKLIEKSIRTLYVCMRDNFMDCPDRERGQWIGDVSVQTPQVFYIFDPAAQKLLRKAISDFIMLRKDKVLVGNVPGAHFAELPSQSLVAVSEFGLVAEYYNYSRDVSVLKEAFEPIMEYLSLWELDERGLVIGREGNWRWFDHLYNVDEDVLENALYYSALGFAKKAADIIGDHSRDGFIESRRKSISEGFEKHFWQSEFAKSYYSSDPKHVDERANAIAVLSGLCPKERYPQMRKILLTVFNSTPYFERFVLIALCEMGYIKDAFNRMSARYYNLAVNENSTLWEDFYILGTRNHAWTGCPIEIAYKYILGLHTDDGCMTFTAKPVPGIFGKIKATFGNAEGKILEINVDKDGNTDWGD